MTKYRIRLKNGRVIGPFIKSQLFELKTKGHIQGNEEAQVYPTGDWNSITQFDFYKELMDDNKTAITQDSPKEETFVIDLTKLRNQKNEKEIDKIDVLQHEPVAELTETIRMPSPAATKSTPAQKPTATAKLELELDNKPVEDDTPTKTKPAKGKAKKEEKFELELDVDDVPEGLEDNGDKTLINPIAQQDIERIKRKQKEEADRKQAEEERVARETEEKRKADEARRLIEADESTQMIKLDRVKSDLIQIAEEEEVRIEKEAKEIKKKKKAQEAAEREEEEDDEEVDEEAAKKKKLKVVVMICVAALLYVILFPSDDKPKRPPFVHQEPKVDFPIPFDKADSKRSKIEYEKAIALFAAGDYISIIKAGMLLKSSYENNLDNEDALGLLLRSYAEQLRYARQDKQASSLVVFNMIQAKRPYLVRNPNGVIGLNLFYMNINKPQAAADVVAKYLKLYPKNVTPDLFAAYLQTLMKIGKLDLAKQFKTPLEKAPQKTRYVYDALIEYSILNQETKVAEDYVNDAMKQHPKLVGFYLKKADMLLKDKNIKEAEIYLTKAQDLNLENNDFNRAKYLELKGLITAFKGDVKTATAIFQKSLSIEDSMELRMRLADLGGNDNPQSDADKLIAESKAIKQLNLAKDFFEKRSYELAMSAAAKASDAYPGHIPSELFLAKVQLKLGLAKQALQTLEELIKKYPDDKSVNLALVDAYIDTYKFNDAKNRIGVLSGGELKHSYEFASANGRLYIKMGDSLQAISWLKNSINMNPLNDNDIYLLSELLIKRANFDAARSLLLKCIELDPVNPDYRIAYSKIVYEQQDDQAAIGYLLGLLDEFGENPKILSEMAIFYYRAGKVKDFEYYKDKLEKMPVKDKSLYEFLIRAALLDEKFDDIPGLVEKLLAIEPGDIEAMMTAGRVLYESGKFKEAKEWFTRVYQKLDTYPKVRYYNAKISFLAKDYKLAKEEVEADLKANGDNDADLTLLAQIYVEEGELIQAENLFKRAQKINPKAFESLMGLADISSKRNNFDLALDLYKRAMKEKGDEPVIHKKIGDVYRLLGQGGLAVESYKMYLEMSPEAADKKQIESYINLMQ